MNLIADVMTPAAVLVAVLTGLAFGYFLLAELIQSDSYGVATANAKRFGLLIGGLGVAFIVVGFLGQVVASILVHDDQWPRAAARGVNLVIFAIFTGVGTWAGLHREWRHR